MRREVTEYNPAPALFALRKQPVTVRDGTVYRWRTERQPSGCPCTWMVLCASERAQGKPPLCEGPIESELTLEWPEVPEGARR